MVVACQSQEQSNELESGSCLDTKINDLVRNKSNTHDIVL